MFHEPITAPVGTRQPRMACDFNRLAVKTTQNNIRLNKFGDRVLAFQAKGEEILSIPCDLMVANIHYDVIHHLIESPFFLKKNGLFCLDF